MPAKRGSNIPTLKIDYTSLLEEQAAKFVRGTTPWIAWLLGVPLAALGFWLLGKQTHQHTLVSAGLLAATVTVTFIVWHTTHARRWGRIHHALNALCGLGWITAVATWGWGAGHGALLIFYAIGGLILVLTWNVRYTTHTDTVEDVLTPAQQGASKHVDLAYVVRVLAGNVPAIRSAAEKGGKVVPALVGPWREPARDVNGHVPKAITGTVADSADTVDPASAAKASAMWSAISKNWKDLAAHKVPDLNGARLRALDVKPWRIRSEVILVRGVQTPKLITDHREILASQNALPLSSVLVKANPKNHARVFLDFVLEDVLSTVRMWPGPHAIGQSIAAAPTRFGLYEDRQYAERFGPAISEELAKKIGRSEKNLSHLLSEGMNGSGKSTTNRILVTDGATRLDIEEWLIDTVKKLQTFGQLGQAFEWFATTVPEARAQVRFLADVVIPGRADYLGAHGFDNWETGCGIPYLRVTVEEGGIVANELDKLDAVLNSARSTGTEINLSAQRAHHALVDTNVRAAFGDTLSFGAKNIEDVFVMPDEMRDAGADPSLWANKQPGMTYYGASDLDFERQLMPVRGFKPDVDDCRTVIAEHAPVRTQWIADNCPDWAQLLREMDTREIYAKRTTGADILSKIEAAERRKAGRTGPAPVVPGSAPDAEPPAGEDDSGEGLLVQFPNRSTLAEEDEVVEAELMPMDDEEPVSMDELNLPDEAGDEVADAVKEDADIDPRVPLPPLAAGDDIDFGRREQKDIPRDQALATLRDWLLDKGNGFEFAPRDLYDELCEATGKSAAWIRNELSTTLADSGLVQHDRLEGRYTVALHREDGAA